MLSRVLAVIGKFASIFSRGINRCKKEYLKTTFESCGKNVYIGNNCIFTAHNITIKNHVYIGSNCVIQSTHGKIVIGNHVMFGPGVHIHGGNHIYNRVECYMDDCNDKVVGADGEVVIEDDCWIGANAMILKNVTVQAGSIVAAGAIVTRDVPSCSIVAGNPAKVIKMRFGEDELKIHEVFISKGKCHDQEA